MKFNEYVKNEMLTEAKKRKIVKDPGKELVAKNAKLLTSIDNLKNKGAVSSPTVKKINTLRIKKFNLEIKSNEIQIEIYKLMKDLKK